MKRKLAILLTLLILCGFLACFVPIVSAQQGPGWQNGPGWETPSPSPFPASYEIRTAAQVMAALFVIVALFVGLAAARREDAGDGSVQDGSLLGSSGSILGYVICIAFLLLMAAILANWGF